MVECRRLRHSTPLGLEDQPIMHATPLTAPQPWPQIASRPLLGANGTEAMSDLLARDGQRATDLVDYFKVGPFMGHQSIANLAARYPLMLHLDDTLSGHEPLSAERVGTLVGFIELTGTPWTSEHIGFSVPDVDLDSALITQPASALLARETAMANIIRSARALADALPVPLLLENIPYFPNLAHVHVTEPDFVREVVLRTGCDMLLDLAHARVSADVLGHDVYDYVAALPLDRVVEIHLSGPRPLRQLDPDRRERVRQNAESVSHLIDFGEDNLVDAHEPMQEADYQLLEWTLARCRPQALSLEYFRDADALRTQLDRLARMIGR
jgi:hypothetical protein